MQAGIPT